MKKSELKTGMWIINSIGNKYFILRVNDLLYRAYCTSPTGKLCSTLIYTREDMSYTGTGNMRIDKVFSQQHELLWNRHDIAVIIDDVGYNESTLRDIIRKAAA